MRLKTFTWLFVVTISTLLAMVTTAAAETVLPEFTVESTFTGTFGKSQLNASGAEISSSEGAITGSELISKRLGKATIWFKGSQLGGSACQSLGDTTGNILVPVEWHVVPPSALLALLIKETHIDCKFLATLVLLLSGSVLLGKVSPTNTSTTTFTLEINAPSKKQEVPEYENNAAEKIKTALKLGIDSGTENATGSEEVEKATITTEKATELLAFTGELVFQNTEEPFKVKLSGGLLVTVEYKKDLFGTKESGELSVLFTTGFEEGAGTNCKASRMDGQTCEVKVKCPNVADLTTGKMTVESADKGIRAATRKLLCVA